MRWPILFAGISGALMVAMGAYASHAPVAEQAQDWLRIGAQYGIWHSLALVAVAAVSRGTASRWLTLAAVAFAAGILLFSGTLFLRALLDWAWVSKATPLGGMSFIAGWLLLAIHGVAGATGSRTG
jgi:uncharacterized membrane protein YgdD (TMEM256/DUF423 family)